MESLRGIEVRKLFAFLRELSAWRTEDQLSDHLVESLSTLIDCDVCSFDVIDTRRQRASFKYWPTQTQSIPDAPEILGTYASQQPVIAHVNRTKDEQALMVSDFLTLRQFKQTDIYQEFYRPLHIPYNMGMQLLVSDQQTVSIGHHRQRKDFSERDRLLLNILRPHILQAFANASSVTRMEEERAALGNLLEDSGQTVVSLQPDRQVGRLSTRACALFLDYGLATLREGKPLPEPIRGWLRAHDKEFTVQGRPPSPLKPFVIVRNMRTLRLQLVSRGAWRMLIFQEVHSEIPLDGLTHFSLSRRETEVLGWIVRGKSNPEIAAILSLSVRTVHKHVEHIYVKLGVENRHAAMTMAMEAMQRGRFGNGGL